ncbi:MAG: hypothetical protein EXS40_03305 [Opitutaceae bacterium]|nr:hypothetical protein [Opitutaceae bacterium]
MDNELKQLEAGLKGLSPVAPSRTLRERLGADLTPTAANTRNKAVARPSWKNPRTHVSVR